MMRRLLLNRDTYNEIFKVGNIYGIAIAQAYKFFNFFEVLNYHKISRLSNSGLNTGDLSNFILLFSFLATVLYYRLFL